MKPEDFLQFIKKTQHLKSVLRHSWTDNIKRQESTAEHSWHMAMMAIVLEPYLKNRINLSRVLKLISVHDIGEIIEGDIPAFRVSVGKHDRERKAVRKIINGLPSKTRKEIMGLWEEYNEKQTLESIFVKMLDVIDVIFQHLIADISTWSKIEFTFNLTRISEKYFQKEPFMMEIYNLILDKLSDKARSFRTQRR